eukprot:TRINITY_DN1835_c0_g1_i3.p1 TRINITY_DN1835_c0_g1~~TRINITY_DN1835_c0_g1_i3.p1  ORF type:complete len:288 (-),score=35.14 TRINITY_DN1835_c0_g1_i3:429-1292(-)
MSTLQAVRIQAWLDASKVDDTELFGVQALRVSEGSTEADWDLYDGMSARLPLRAVDDHDDEVNDDDNSSVCSSAQSDCCTCFSSVPSLVSDLEPYPPDFHRIEKSIDDGRTISYPSSPDACGTADKQLDVRLLICLLADDFRYRSLGLTAPIVEAKRIEIEEARALADRADDAALHARTLFSLHCLQAALPIEVKGCIASFFPHPPAPPRDEGSDACSGEEGDQYQTRAYCVDFDMRQRIWPQSWLSGSPSRLARSVAHAEFAESRWRHLHQLMQTYASPALVRIRR